MLQAFHHLVTGGRTVSHHTLLWLLGLKREPLGSNQMPSGDEANRPQLIRNHSDTTRKQRLQGGAAPCVPGPGSAPEVFCFMHFLEALTGCLHCSFVPE